MTRAAANPMGRPRRNQSAAGRICGAKIAIGLAITAVLGWLPLRAIWEHWASRPC